MITYYLLFYKINAAKAVHDSKTNLKKQLEKVVKKAPTRIRYKSDTFKMKPNVKKTMFIQPV